MTNCTKFGLCSQWHKMASMNSISQGNTKQLIRIWLHSQVMSYTQYLPAKPIKHGIKVWMRCDSESPYLHEDEVYLSWQHNLPNGLAYDVVTKLCQSIAGHNHHIYCDSYFTSIPLLKQLFQMKIYASVKVRDPIRRVFLLRSRNLLKWYKENIGHSKNQIQTWLLQCNMTTGQ